jgi:Rod binding domain-containing protein
MDNILSKLSIVNPIQQSSMERTIDLSKIRDRNIDSPSALRHVAEEMEGLFISQMINHMFKGIKTDGLTGGGNGEAMFRDLLVQEYGKAISKANGIGLADSIERQLLERQEVK